MDEAVGFVTDKCKTGGSSPLRLSGAAQTALQRLEAMQKARELDEDPTLTLGLAERLAEELGLQEQFREHVAGLYHERRNDKHGHVDYDKKSQPLRRLIADLRINRLLTLNYDTQIEQEFEQLFRTSQWEQDQSPGKGFLEKSDFEKLCSAPEDKPETKALNLPARVEHSDGTSRSVLSVSMNAGNIGELVNFALQPRQFVGQVFHLHGRFDRPKDLVLTDADYRRTYMRSDEQAQTFEEGLSALMSGNDILFVGVGMTEADLLRPLRQFVSRDKSPEFSKRHVFAMKEHTVKLDMEWLHGEASDCLNKLDELTDQFSDHHLTKIDEPNTEFQSGAHRDFNKDDRFAVKYRTEYGVYTIFHGDEKLRKIRLATQLLRAVAVKDGDEQVLQRKISAVRFLAAVRATRRAIDDLYAECVDDIGDTIPPTLFAKTERSRLETPVSSGELKETGLLFLKSTLRRVDNQISAVSDTEDRLYYTLAGICTHTVGTQAFKRSLSRSKALADRLEALETEARSRALDRALAEFSEIRDKWWSEWRKKPLSRNSEFRRSYTQSDRSEMKHPSAARHRPIYDPVPEDGLCAPVSFAVLNELQKLACDTMQKIQRDLCGEARQVSAPDGPLEEADTNSLKGLRIGDGDRDFTKVPPRRIVRASIPRGGGKGSLLHILQQTVPPRQSSNRLYVDQLFDAAEGCGPKEDAHLHNGRYFGSFFLHLSFSMEFASVISALKTFVEQATAGIVVEYPKVFLTNAKNNPDLATKGAFSAYLAEKLNGTESSAFEAFINECEGLGGQDRKQRTRRLVETFTAEHWSLQTLSAGAGRAHRLEELRLRMTAFTQAVNILHDKNLRLAVVMSGLDKLCDGTGTAYNPMFRALFRMLTGCGAKYPSESDVAVPFDILLINGDKDVPLRYLSHEVSRKELKEKLGKPGHQPPKDHYSSYAQYRPIGNGKFLQVWPRLSAIPLAERYWVGADTLPLQQVLEKGVLPAPAGKSGEMPLNASEISRLCKTSVAVHSWVSGAYRVAAGRVELDYAAKLTEAQTAAKKDRLTKAYLDEKAKHLASFVRRMDAAATRGGIAQVVQELFELHKPELRRWGQQLNNSKNKEAIPDLETYRTWPSKDQRLTTQIPAERCNTAEANRMVDLVYLILSHLALFPMPVEARVLYGCDEIYRLLEQICMPEGADTDDHINKESDGKGGVRVRSNWRDTSRLVRLRLLSQVLNYLHEAKLLIAVRSKPLTSDPQLEVPLNIGDVDRTPEDIHTRFTIQHQLREFAARQMDLSLADQGERNFFQVSIYCDQPRDLPAPREEHYELVRQIMDRQIDLVRNTAWTLMQFIPPDRISRLSSADRKLLDYGLRRRMVKRSDDEGKLDAHLPSVHAVPQRIRALYGLLRSGFSIGTISRLTSLQDKELDQPYERFRGWLRGVTNAAIGWDHILDALFYEESNGEPSRKVDPDKSERTFKTISDQIKTKPDITDVMREFKGFARPLYRDEISWLLNERGVVSLVQGQIFDAIPLLQRALEEMQHDDIGGNYDPALHAAVRRVRLNMAIALIDRGHLERAKQTLSSLQLPDDFSSHSGSQISWLAEGYLGLIDHLSGNFDVAEKRYKGTIARAQDREMMRVVGLFAKHQADLYRRLNKFDKARNAIALATSSALNCAQRDILHLAKISEGHIELKDPEGDLSKASVCTLEALEFAQNMGIARLESEAKSLQAATMLSQNERMLAGTAATEAAAIANRNGLRLNKLQALKHYGSALRLRGQNDLARQILTETRREAERRGYQGLAIGLAEELQYLS